jgi:hypothetical protein
MHDRMLIAIMPAPAPDTTLRPARRRRSLTPVE